MNKIYILLFLISCNTLHGQNIKGVVINATNNQPIEFVNIGIVEKNIGTVTNLNGKFNLFVDSAYDNDTLMFSVI